MRSLIIICSIQKEAWLNKSKSLSQNSKEVRILGTKNMAKVNMQLGKKK